MKLIDKDAVLAIIEQLKDDAIDMEDKARWFLSAALTRRIEALEVIECNEVPATVIVNKYGNRFISSWSGLKEYDDFKEGEEIKILIPKK